MKQIFRIATMASLVAAAPLTGCIIADSSSVSGAGSAGGGTYGPTTPDASSTTAPKVPIDLDQTLTVNAGAGAGIFVQVTSAGHWNVRWTCDTNVSGKSCEIQLAVRATGANGATNVVTAPATGILTVAPSGQLLVDDFVGASLDSLDFDATPGSSIVLSGWFNGAPIPAYVFYVNDGKVSTEPTDPIELVPVPSNATTPSG